ncbi:lysophospholipid acyltransferase family protein [Rhodocytophaga aerolata]|uniref:Lysophospholipid acyltransferase family protein n=1 Tax=Rhodocytophaga aerolata TaxID=455078 RepID=A0ABT8R443_9BACT|nr:lysophospholipid acyltransferase family protein [Rhodocytophaga aerolata]MDO1446048.1 lysophospholipid acyltransferase family protein [Rhodocytophaga aerolata]
MYALLKLIVQLALRVFYKDIHVQIKGAIPKNGPLLVVSNHPNTFMDPIVIASILPQQVYFLTNGSVFKNPFIGWLLGKMHMIPIYRKEDVNGQAPDNRASFAKCFDFLANKGTLLIFPEGSSVHERRLRKLKTGTARIALGAEAEHEFTLGVQILTIGLNYSDPIRFRSELFVNIDAPIAVAEYASAYLKDPVEAVNQLTEQMRLRLEKHVIITRTQEEDALAANIEAVYKSRLVKELNINEEEPEQEFLLTKNILEAIRFFEEKAPARVQQIQANLADYQNSLRQLRLEEEVFHKKDNRKGFYTIFISILYILLGFPLYLYGLINNYIPYIIPSKVASLIIRDKVYRAPLMMTIGIFSFSLCYSLQVHLFHQLISPSGWYTAAYAGSLPISGFFVLHYWNYLVSFYQNWTFASIVRSRKSQVAAIIRKRLIILRELENARKEYNTYLQMHKKAVKKM